DYLQNRIIRETVRFERELLKTYKKNPHKAIEMLAEYSSKLLLESKNRAVEISEENFNSN
ncbi:MAG: hypothetical protein ABFS12_12385, partial [Bacteroidota bacterium]